MTKFIDKPNCNCKITVFRKYLDAKEGCLKDARTGPNDWKNVEYIGSGALGDIFKCWDDNENSFALMFGTKGDEFKNKQS